MRFIMNYMTQALFRQIERAITNQDPKKIIGLLEKEDFHTVSDIINALSGGRFFVFNALSPELQAKVVLGLNKISKRAVVPKLDNESIASFLKVSDDDDAADILEFLVGRWNVEKVTGLSGEGRKAQDYVCGLAPRIRKLEERAQGRAKQASAAPFSWIFGREIQV